MNKYKDIMSGHKDERERISWQTVNNTLTDRMTSDSFKNDFHVKAHIKKRTKIVNSIIRKYSSLKSYSQYLDIKRSQFKKTSIDEESDYEISTKSKIPANSYRNLDCSYSSLDEEDEDNDYPYDDVFIGGNPKLSLSERKDKHFNSKNKPRKTGPGSKSSEIRSSSSTSIGKQNTSSRKSVQPSSSRQSTLRKSTRVNKKQANVLNRKSISNFEENHVEEDKEQIEEEKEELSDTVAVVSSKKTVVQNQDAQTTKLRNKTRDDVKKNLYALIGDSETEIISKQNLNKSELNETQNSDLNVSNLMALAQSTKYLDDSSDMSDKPEKKSLISDFLTIKNKNQPKDSGIEEDSTEESAKFKEKCKKVIENEKSPLKQKCVSKYVSNNSIHIENSSNQDETIYPEVGDSTENQNVREDETLKNNENACVQSEDLHKVKHPLKIIGSEIVNQKFKIVAKEQKAFCEIHQEERNDEESDVEFENCDKSESLNWKLEDSGENCEEQEEKEEEKSEQRNIQKGHGKKSNIQKGGKENESEDEIENKTEENDEGLQKITKFIIKKSINKKSLKQETYQEQKGKTKELSIRELEKREVSNEEKSDKENKKAKKMRKENKRREEKRRCDLEKLLYSSSESEFEEQDKGKESPNKNQEKRKEFSSKKELEIEEKLSNTAKFSESQEDEKKIEIQQKKDKVERRRKIEETVKECSTEEDLKSGEDEKRTEVQQKKVKGGRKIEEEEENQIERSKVEEEKKEDTRINEEEENKNMKVTPEMKNNDYINENADEDKKYDSEIEEEKEELISDDEVILKIVEKSITEKENSESSNAEKLETENEDSNEKNYSRQIFTQIVEREDDSESEEEKQDEEELRLTLESKENFVNLDDNNITIEEHKIEMPENYDAVQEDSEEEEEVMSAESVKKLQQIKKLNFTLGSDSSSSDEEFSQAQMNRFKTLINEKSDSSNSESEEDMKKKSPKKKKDFPEKSPKKRKISEDVVKTSEESKKDEEKKTEEVVQRGEGDAAFDNYIQEGISFLKKQEDGRRLSSSQIIEDVESPNLESSQIISAPESQICLENEKKVSKKNKEKEIRAECLNYALSSLERRNKECNKEIEHQIVLEEMQTFNNNENATPKDRKKITKLKELVERDNLIEQNLTSTINFDDISDSEEVWMVQIPKKEISTDLVGKKLSYNGSVLKLGENSYKASERKLKTLTCIFNSGRCKRPYKTVNIRPVSCLTVGPKIGLNSLPVKNQTEKKKRKRSNVQDSPVNVSTEEILAKSDISRKQKKKKLFNEDFILVPGDNKIESSHVAESVNAGSKKKRNHFLSESEEDEKVEPKADIKRKKKWDVNEFALDEKPPIGLPENLSAKKQKACKRTDNVSDTSDMEKKPKKEILKKEQLNPLDIPKTKSETSSTLSPKIEKQKNMLNNTSAKTSFTKVKKYSSLDVSKVKVKDNEGHTDTDSSMINERVINEKHKKKKKSDNWKKLSELENIGEKLQTKIDINPEEKKKKKKPGRDSEKLNILSTGNKIDKTTEGENFKNIKLLKTSHKNKEETVDGQDFSSDFEVEDKRKSEKKLKKKSCFQNIFNREGFKNQKEVKPEKEKTKKKTHGFIDFEH